MGAYPGKKLHIPVLGKLGGHTFYRKDLSLVAVKLLRVDSAIRYPNVSWFEIGEFTSPH